MPATFDIRTALVRQRDNCAQLGSELYAGLLTGLVDDYDRGGLTAIMLDPISQRPVHDAVPLRLLGAMHAVVLDGRAPLLGRHYPSVQGNAGPSLVDDFLTEMANHRDEVVIRLQDQVQTNEVARACALIGGFAEVSRRFGLPLSLLELGASAGLLLRWDHYRYQIGPERAGDPDSPVTFAHNWTNPPDLGGLQPVTGRHGCDLSPVDVNNPRDCLRLLSFVWPDQLHRLEHLRAALAVARRVPLTIDRCDAGDWVAQMLQERPDHATTVVYHSIVWQYLPSASRDRLRSALAEHGSQANPSRPLTWLRMEPHGPVADVTLTTWPSGETTVLGSSGYHGDSVDWRMSSGDAVM